MISSLRGTVLAVRAGLVHVEVGGVGFAVQTTPNALAAARVGHELTLHTALLVRDDELALVGFPGVDELEVFELLRSVTGVGPKSAIGVLATMSPAQVAAAIAADDDGAFRAVSGIGPKTAKLIVVTLAGKLAAPLTSHAAAVPASIDADVVTALVGLGWPERIAAQVVGEVQAEAGESASIDAAAVLRRALARLGPAVRS